MMPGAKSLAVLLLVLNTMDAGATTGGTNLILRILYHAYPADGL